MKNISIYNKLKYPNVLCTSFYMLERLIFKLLNTNSK